MPELLMSKYFLITNSSDPLTSINRLFIPRVLRDRFNILNHYSPYKLASVKDEIGWKAIQSTEPEKEINQIIDEQAIKYINLDKPIYVSWSGGVDSTAVLVALLKNEIKKDKLYIICNDNSKKEYSFLFNELVDEKYNVISSDRVGSYYNNSKGIILTGWCADQLFGSNIHLKDLTLYHLPWMDALRKFCNRQNIYINNYDEIYDVYSEYARRLGWIINTWCEFAWMFNFCIKWSYVSDATKLSIINSEARNNAYAFFEDYDFQRWSVCNRFTLNDINVNTNDQYYKRPLKQYIYEYTKDSEYLKHKNKQSSVGLRLTDRNIAIHDLSGYHFYPLSQNNLLTKLYLK